jgi:putative hydrolase of the HAD superfamily
MIAMVTFDAAGTLFHLPRGVGWHYQEVAHRYGLELDETALNRAFSAAWKSMPARASSRFPRPDDDRGWWRELVDRVLHTCGAAPGFDADAYFAELYVEFIRPGIWELYPEVPEILAALRPHYRLGIISNFDTRLDTILHHLGIAHYFDPTVISSEVGADKPDPWIFECALARAHLPAHSVAHVGDDHRADWEGATAAGLSAFLLTRPTNSLRELPAWLASFG